MPRLREMETSGYHSVIQQHYQLSIVHTPAHNSYRTYAKGQGGAQGEPRLLSRLHERYWLYTLPQGYN